LDHGAFTGGYCINIRNMKKETSATRTKARKKNVQV